MCRWRVAVAGGLLPLPGIEAKHPPKHLPTTFVGVKLNDN
uniref:Uncharacterized protein n=1 Tax=Arundo donax TaxID=35708 RepID=A0A0A8YGA0_ARUDO